MLEERSSYKLRHEYNFRATKAKIGTAKTLQMTNEELRSCESELADAKRKVAKMDRERKELEDELFMVGR